MKVVVILALAQNKKNTITNLEKLTTVSLNIHQNIFLSHYKYIM